MLKMNEISNKSGSLKNLNLAMVDSMVAMTPQKIKAFIMKKAIPEIAAHKLKELAMPHGKNKLDPKAIKIANLLAAAHSISASFLPEYSNIIASWIIVNSR